MRRVFVGIVAICLALGAPARAEDAPRNPLIDQGSWPDLRGDILGEAPIHPGEALLSLTAPYRAHEAAIVPVVLHQNDPDLRITALDLVVDENPAPLVAHLEFGPAMHPLQFETRVRVNQYSNIRAIAATPEGLFMSGRFVKASGGCSAPATRDPAKALERLGEMRLRQFGDAPARAGQRREAQVMIRHPNYSGLQRDQITQLFISAHFIDQLEVWQGEARLFALSGGISISENPVFRFSYTDNGAGALRVRARDTAGNIFEQSF